MKPSGLSLNSLSSDHVKAEVRLLELVDCALLSDMIEPRNSNFLPSTRVVSEGYGGVIIGSKFWPSNFPE